MSCGKIILTNCYQNVKKEETSMSTFSDDDLSTYVFRTWDMYRRLSMSQAPFYKEDADISSFNQFVTVQLYSGLISTSEGIFALLLEKCYWEAEILLRTVFEGTVKYLYMMSCDLKEDSEIVKEFYLYMPEMQKIDQHKKAQEALEIFRLFTDRKHPFDRLLLSDDELDNLEQKYPRKRRREIEQRWGFGTLLKVLIEMDEKYKILAGFYYAYFQSSHVTHFDGDAVKSRYEAIKTNVEEEDFTYNYAYALRILCNVLTLGLIRASEYISKYKIDVEQYADVMNAVTELNYELDLVSHNLVEDHY